MALPAPILSGPSTLYLGLAAHKYSNKVHLSMFLLEKMLDEMVRTTQRQQLDKNSVSSLFPAALLLRLCLLAVCWLNMSEGINPISRGCWGEIGRSVVWLLPPSMHVVKGGGGWGCMTPAQALTQIYSVCAWVHPGCVWQTCWGLPCCHLSVSLTADHSKKKKKVIKATLINDENAADQALLVAEQDYFSNRTPDM